MRVSLANVAAVLMLLAVSRGSTAQTVPRAEDVQRVERLVATLTQEAATLCPLSDPGDQHALDRCRSALFNDSYFKRSLARIVLWGRPSPVRGARLKDTTLTQFGGEVLSGLYLPLFMFNGRYRVEYDATEARYRARLEGVFRNNLMPGQYPYPFWHDAKKWSDYQRANGITRVMAAVRDNRMPLDEIGIEKELDSETKALLLKYGATFESTVNAAYAW